MHTPLDKTRALALLRTPLDPGRDGIGVHTPGFEGLAPEALRGALVVDLDGLSAPAAAMADIEAAIRLGFGLLGKALAAASPPAAAFIQGRRGRPDAIDPDLSRAVFDGRAFTSAFRGLVTVIVPRSVGLDDAGVQRRLARWRRRLLEICDQDNGDGDFAAGGRALDHFFKDPDVRWRPSGATSLRTVDLRPLLVFAFAQSPLGSEARRQCQSALGALSGDAIDPALTLPAQALEDFRAKMAALLLGDLDRLPGEYGLLQVLAERAEGRPAHEPLIEYVVAQRAPFDPGHLNLFDRAGNVTIALPEPFQCALDDVEDRLDTILGDALRQRLYRCWLGVVERD